MLRRLAVGAIILMVAATSACGATTVMTAPPQDASQSAVEAGEAADARGLDADGTDTVGPVRARVVDGTIPVAPATVENLDLPPEPTHLRVGRLDVDMRVIDVGIDAEGGMELPDSAGVAGWFRLGGNPGGGPREAQNTVIAAHVDDAVMGRGPFAELRDARAGDAVEVTLDDGSVVTYVVDRVQQTSKRDVDFSVVFGADDGALVLVTCGGRWDADVRHYEDNVLVWALPEDAG